MSNNQSNSCKRPILQHITQCPAITRIIRVQYTSYVYHTLIIFQECSSHEEKSPEEVMEESDARTKASGHKQKILHADTHWTTSQKSTLELYLVSCDWVAIDLVWLDRSAAPHMYLTHCQIATSIKSLICLLLTPPTGKRWLSIYLHNLS